MIPPIVIDQILRLEAADVLAKYVSFKKRGSTYQACCPFHNEKTPSFSTNPKTNRYKCFGCGKSGNVIDFVMEFKKVEFPAACQIIAQDHNIIIPREEVNEEQQKKYNHLQSLYTVTRMAMDFFKETLYKPENALALNYCKGRWKEETLNDFCIGYAPRGWDNLKSWSKEKGIKEDYLLEAGLLTESKGKVFDSFRDRIIFPILNRTGRVVGFTGRDFSGDKDAPKYFNTRETPLYTKGNELFGLHAAYKSMKEKGFVYLVEGNADVLKLHELGRINTICTCGTSLTTEQIEKIKKDTDSVTLIGDSDQAGKNAVIKSAKMIIQAGMYCNVIPLPFIDDKKEDPDSFFTSADQFDDYSKEQARDFVFFLAETRKDKCKNPDLKSRLIDELSMLVTMLPASSHSLYIEQLGKMIPTKKHWQDGIKAALPIAPVVEKKNEGIPEVMLSHWEKYGFHEENNCYLFSGSNGKHRGSNFSMDPLFHIRSIINSKRLYNIKNEFGFSQTIELAQKDLISLSNFRLRVESLGNFLFEGSETDLMRLKRWLYEKTLVADEIIQLGYHKQGFWAWSNGIFNGQFVEIDKNGIVSHEELNYYIPSSSDIFKQEERLFVAERKFKHHPGSITLHDWSVKLINVYGDNAIFALCFYFASLFRDYIYRLWKFFPILNLFGPKGAGKTELAISIMQFFGPQDKGPSITNSTRPALADHMAGFINGIAHLDEYKNEIEPEKIELLKDIYGGTGRNRMNMEKDKKKEVTAVDVALMLSGQHIPNADIALYSRLIFLSFYKVEFTEKERSAFLGLKAVEQLGLTHITHELLSLRTDFLKNFLQSYDTVTVDLMKEIGEIPIEDRIFRNWLIVVAAYHALEGLISVPWSYQQLVSKAAQLILFQNTETKRTNELATFWQIVEFLVNEGELKEEVDFRLEMVNSLHTNTVNVSEFKQPKLVLFINHSRLLHKYRIHGKRSGENVLPINTLEYYLTNCREYLGKKASVAFKVEKDRKIVEDKKTEFAGDPPKTITTRRITTAMTFDYADLNIDISTSVDEEGENEPF
jgi:DNA primase